jgi:hypothetical protein
VWVTVFSVGLLSFSQTMYLTVPKLNQCLREWLIPLTLCNAEFFLCSFVGNCEIDLEIKRYFCRAGVKSIQVSVSYFHLEFP